MATATTTKTKTKTTKKTTAKKATKKRATPKKNLVIVESPAKAKTIEKYLGRNYKVVASVGHIRDLKNQVCLLILKTTTNLSTLIFVVRDLLSMN